VDLERRGALPQPFDQAEQALQVHRHLQHHAEERRRITHGVVLFLGQRHGWLVHRQMGKQNYVLHCLRLWTANMREAKEEEVEEEEAKGEVVEEEEEEEGDGAAACCPHFGM